MAGIAGRPGSRAFGWAGRLATLGIVGFAWVFFRAPSLQQALTMFGGFTNFNWRPEYAAAISYLGVVSAVAVAIDLRLEYAKEEYLFESWHPRFALAAALGMCSVITVFGAIESSAFIYFQF